MTCSKGPYTWLRESVGWVRVSQFQGQTKMPPAQDEQAAQSDQTNVITLQPIEDLRDKLTGPRNSLGAVGNRVGHAIALLGRERELGSMALSRLLDTDHASETAAWTRDRMRANASTSVLAQANAQPWIALDLLR